jgi:hypothetical protein
MKKYNYKYNEDVFKLEIETIFLDKKELCDITKLYINDILLLENNLSKTDCYLDIIEMMLEYDFENIQSALIEKEYSKKYSLFTNHTLYYKRNINDFWNVMSGKDYDNFYDWLTIFLLPECNIKKQRRVKINNILNNGIE